VLVYDAKVSSIVISKFLRNRYQIFFFGPKKNAHFRNIMINNLRFNYITNIIEHCEVMALLYL